MFVTIGTHSKLEEINEDGPRKKGRLTQTVEELESLQHLAKEGMQEVQQLKTVDEKAQEERNLLYYATKEEFQNVQNRIGQLESTITEMNSYRRNLGNNFIN